jgi:hypothetical protein
MNSRLVLTGSLVAAAFIAAACSTTTTSTGPCGPAPSAGDETGQGVNAFGAPWYVVSPSGAQIG